jgi:hypothetical protein
MARKKLGNIVALVRLDKEPVDLLRTGAYAAFSLMPVCTVVLA